VIVVDSSVWIDFLNGRNASHVRRLRAILGIDEVIVGDLTVSFRKKAMGLPGPCESASKTAISPLRNRRDHSSCEFKAALLM
jgi:predicted nucleic acid-binding protein